MACIVYHASLRVAWQSSVRLVGSECTFADTIPLAAAAHRPGRLGHRAGRRVLDVRVERGVGLGQRGNLGLEHALDVKQAKVRLDVVLLARRVALPLVVERSKVVVLEVVLGRVVVKVEQVFLGHVVC